MKRAALIALALLGFCAANTTANAAERGPFKFKTKLKTRYLYEDNRDLAQVNDAPLAGTSLEMGVRAEYKPHKNLKFLVEARAGKSFGDNLSIDQQTGETLRSDQFAELRQFWVQAKNPAGLNGAAIQLGRQRLRDPYGLWWNDDLDALRLSYDTERFSGFVGLGQNFADYSTADYDFGHDEESRLRIFGHAQWTLPQEHKIEAHMLHEHDHSGEPQIGELFPSDDLDREDARLTWLGLRLSAEDREWNAASLSYRAGLMGLSGEVDALTSSAVGSDTRRVTGHNTRDVFGWSFDGGLALAFKNIILKPTMMLGYAFGSGDDGQGGTDHAFRQTDLHTNTSAFGSPSRAIHNYGEAFRPELSNLHILSAGLGANLLPATDMSLLYHRYWLDEQSGSLGSTRIRQNVTGLDYDVGQELDLVFNSDLTQELGLTKSMMDRVALRASLGAFRAGDAFGPGAGEVTWRGLIELQGSF